MVIFQKISSVYFNLNLICAALAVVSIGYDNIVIWEYENTANRKIRNTARNRSSQIREVENKTTVLPDYLHLIIWR